MSGCRIAEDVSAPGEFTRADRPAIHDTIDMKRRPLINLGGSQAIGELLVGCALVLIVVLSLAWVVIEHQDHEGRREILRACIQSTRSSADCILIGGLK